jgi:hypothetical protein
MVAQLIDANLLTSGSTEDVVARNLSANLSSGVATLSAKIPTFFTIIAAVLILGFVLILWRQYQASKVGGVGGTI